MVCTFVEGKEKLLTPKLDSLLKHQGRRKVKKSMSRVDVGQFYFNKDFMHAKYEHAYMVVDDPSILDRLQAKVSYK
jgi:hypothetical protein